MSPQDVEILSKLTMLKAIEACYVIGLGAYSIFVVSWIGLWLILKRFGLNTTKANIIWGIVMILTLIIALSIQIWLSQQLDAIVLNQLFPQ